MRLKTNQLTMESSPWTSKVFCQITDKLSLILENYSILINYLEQSEGNALCCAVNYTTFRGSKLKCFEMTPCNVILRTK
jgi:hypothetical protein